LIFPPFADIITWIQWRRIEVGSEPTAAGGGIREASEWPRSASGKQSAADAGNRNRAITGLAPLHNEISSYSGSPD